MPSLVYEFMNPIDRVGTYYSFGGTLKWSIPRLQRAFHVSAVSWMFIYYSLNMPGALRPWMWWRERGALPLAIVA